MRVLAIDPAVRNTGYAVLEGDPHKPTVLAFDVISIPKTIPQSAALSANPFASPAASKSSKRSPPSSTPPIRNSLSSANNATFFDPQKRSLMQRPVDRKSRVRI